MGTIILVRHGESESNVDKTILRHKPNHLIELTEKGRAQAQELGKQLTEFSNISHLWASPLLRTQQTAHIITNEFEKLSRRSLDIRYDIRLREVDIGNYVEDFEKIRKERFEIGKFYYRFPNGESMADVYVRVKQFLLEYQEPLKYGFHVIVTHAGTMNVFKMILKDWLPELFDRLPKPNNCEMQCFTYDSTNRLYHNGHS